MHTTAAEPNCLTYELVDTRQPPAGKRFAFQRTPEGQVNLEVHERDPLTGAWAVSPWGPPFPAHAMHWFVRVHTAARLAQFLDWYFDTEIMPILLGRAGPRSLPRFSKDLVCRWLDSPPQEDYARKRAHQAMGAWAKVNCAHPHMASRAAVSVRGHATEGLIARIKIDPHESTSTPDLFELPIMGPDCYGYATVVLGSEWVEPVILFLVPRAFEMSTHWTPDCLGPEMILSFERAFELAMLVKAPPGDWPLARAPLPSGSWAENPTFEHCVSRPSGAQLGGGGGLTGPSRAD